ncbi:MAG: sigma 54-interacting transcriptional regulator [Myxococcota bacterium]
MASAPLREPIVYELDGRDRVVLGREEPGDTKARDGITVPDRWMSAAHAELIRTAEGWRLSDLGSSNGTLTWGRRASTVLLSDGDLFETGTTFWLFRTYNGSERPRSPAPEVGGPTALSTSMLAVRDKLSRLAPLDVPIVFRGATGTGKEVLARAVHDASGRAGPFVALNGASIPAHLVSHELFGVLERADGSERARRGRLRGAHGGTVLLDRLQDLSPEVQLALLRVVQHGEVTPVGSDVPERVNIRFVATTCPEIESLVESGRFRAELWSRLKGRVLDVPPLEARREDLGALMAQLLRRFGLDELSFSAPAYRALLTYDWPHNVRELELGLQSAAALAASSRIEVADLPSDIQNAEPPRMLEKGSEESRERELLRLLDAHKGNVSAVARSMGYSRMQVHRWMKQMGVDPNDYRA